MHEPLRIAPHNLTSRRIWLQLQLWPQGCRCVAIVMQVKFHLAIAALGEVTKLVQKLGLLRGLRYFAVLLPVSPVRR